MVTKFIRDLKGNKTNALIIGSGSSLDYLPIKDIINIFSGLLSGLEFDD